MTMTKKVRDRMTWPVIRPPVLKKMLGLASEVHQFNGIGQHRAAAGQLQGIIGQLQGCFMGLL